LTAADAIITLVGKDEERVITAGGGGANITINGNGSSLTIGDNITLVGSVPDFVTVTDGTFAMTGNSKITGNTVASTVLVNVNGGTFTMTGGSVTGGITSDVSVSTGGIFNISGTASVGTLTLSANTSIDIPGAWTSGGISNLTLQGTATDWVNKQIVQGTGMDAAAIARITLGSFTDTHYIATSGTNMGKLLAIPQQGFSITIPDFVDDKPLASGITLSLSGTGGYPSTGTLTLTNTTYPAGTIIEWYSNLSATPLQSGAGTSLTLTVTTDPDHPAYNNPYNFMGKQKIFVEARLPGGAVYGANVEFEVVP
jgi:hypothetical protein